MPEAWEKAWNVFEKAIDQPPDSRSDFVETACAGDLELRRAVEALLDADSEADALLDRPLVVRAPDDDDRAGAGKVGAYKLLKPIGQGGMSVAYLAVRDDDTFQRRVVVKVVRPGMERDALLRRLKTERQILAGLDHPYVARLYDGGAVGDGIPYFVMEYIEGLPIDAFCDRHELSLEERLELFGKVCSAVHYAHQNLVVHRDIKPSNILVTPEGEPKLLDFGIAKLLNPELASADIEPTATQSRMMTPSYASPEQIRGEAITTATDVYSLGVLLYLLLSGRLPHDFRGKSPAEVERLVIEEEPARPSAALPEERRRRVAGDLDAIVLKALRASARQRYGSVEQLALDVDRYRRGLPVEARRGTWRYRAGKFLGRHRVAVAAAAVIAALVVGFIGALTAQAARVQRQRDEARSERDKKEQVLTLMEEIISYAEPWVAPGRELTVREAVERSVPVLEARLRDQPDVRAELLHATGSMLVRLGEFEEARRQLEEALAERRTLHGDDSREVAETLVRLASVLKVGGEYDAAEESARRAVSILRSSADGAAPPRSLVDALNQLVSVLCYREQFQAAEEPAREALALARKLGGAERNAEVLAMELLATIATKEGGYSEAATLLRQSLALRRSWEGERHPSQIGALHNLGLSLRWLGELEAAERSYEEALEIIRGTYGESHVESAATLNNLAGVRFERGRYREAEAGYREARAIFHEAVGPDHWRSFFLDVRIQSARLRSGHAADAESRLRAGLGRWRDRLGEDHWLVPFTACLIGEAAMFQGRLEEAEPLLRDGFLRLVELDAKHRYQRQAFDRFAELLERTGRADEIARHEAMIVSESP